MFRESKTWGEGGVGKFKFGHFTARCYVPVNPLVNFDSIDELMINSLVVFREVLGNYEIVDSLAACYLNVSLSA